MRRKWIWQCTWCGALRNSRDEIYKHMRVAHNSYKRRARRVRSR